LLFIKKIDFQPVITDLTSSVQLKQVGCKFKIPQPYIQKGSKTQNGAQRYLKLFMQKAGKLPFQDKNPAAGRRV
jgi:hypothetical protein